MSSSQASNGAVANDSSKDEVDRTTIALKFKVASHQRTIGLAALVPRQREGLEDKVRLYPLQYGYPWSYSPPSMCFCPAGSLNYEERCSWFESFEI